MPPSVADFLRPWRKRVRYAALSYATTPGNLGDEIQTIAACQFLPRVDEWVDRERLDGFRSSVQHRIILNGWYLHRPEHWSPSKDLHPLIVAFHLTREMHPDFNVRMMAPASTVLGPTGVEYLRRFEPIGARDLDTMKQLQQAGVEAYFSGCLTLTLRPDRDLPRDQSICAVDVSDDVVAFLTRQHDVAITKLTHRDTQLVGRARFERASSLLRTYASAKAVVTSGLHCALPCLALGTPVLFVEAARDAYRFDGLRDLLHRSSRSEILRGDCHYDLAKPPRNEDGWRALSDRLSAACERFVAAG